MFNYAEMTTAELIDLLFKEEDRVTRAHIEELVRRGDEAKPRLREIVANEEYWYEGQYGTYWIELHAVTILSLMRDPEVLPDLIAAIMHSYFADFDWMQERWPELLAQFGEPAVEPLIKFIEEHQGAFQDNMDYGFARARVAHALAIIAHEHPAVRERVLDFLCARLTDPQEDDEILVSHSLEYPVILDRERGLAAARVAYERGVVDEMVYGEWKEFVKFANTERRRMLQDLRSDLFDFYEPKATTARQERWAREDAADKSREHNRAWSGSPPFPLPFSQMYKSDEVDAPEGYIETDAGNLVRGEKVGRNDPCPCGSGKKYKKCCGKNE
jgi:hypothetical protein